MPYQFVFSINNEVHFRGFLHSQQCHFINPLTHRRCRNRCCMGAGDIQDYCWIHTLRENHLRIRPSTIAGAGQGLFALNPRAPPDAVIFKAGERICYYDGEIIDKVELEDRYGDYTAPYGTQITPGNHDRYEDAATQRGLGSLANQPPRGTAPNAKLDWGRHKGVTLVRLKALRNIRNGQEIFLSYGSEYRMNEPTSYSTKYVRG